MEAFIATILPWPINYAPINWAGCNGQSLTSQQNQALYALIGTTYGGSGSNFNLPELRNRVMIGSITIAKSNGPGTGPNLQSGSTGGAYLPTATVSTQGVLSSANLPGHNHAANFVPTTGSVPVTVSAPAANIPVTIPVGTTPPTGGLTSPLTGNQYLTNVAGALTSKGPYQTSAPSATVNVVGGTASGNPGGSFTGNVTTVTGGSVTVQNNNNGQPNNNPAAFATAGTTGQIQPPPFLAMGFIIATLGLWPDRP